MENPEVNPYIEVIIKLSLQFTRENKYSVSLLEQPANYSENK